MNLLAAWFLLIVSSSTASISSHFTPPCQSQIYCYGELLHTIQMASLFPDSKTFVDMKLKHYPDETLEKFRNFMDIHKHKPSKVNLEEFIKDNFEPPGGEFEKWTPGDWSPKPDFLESINDLKLRQWAKLLHDRWRLLGRKMKADVLKNPQLYSMIPVENPVIVPGGRFREFYYWDTYWIIRGLLISGMWKTVHGMLLNFVSMIKKYGMIPNGGRIYYTMRSQPPLFIQMVDSYLDATNDTDFLKENIHYLEKELHFWVDNRLVELKKEGKTYNLCRYSDSSTGPRPESYIEDVDSAQVFNENDKDAFYSELKTAAESGWDFSSRWMITKAGTNQGNLTDTKAKSIIPVDLNAIVCGNAKVMSKFYRLLNNTDKSNEYSRMADNWVAAVDSMMWDKMAGTWFDYDLENKDNRRYFYASNLAPLWTQCYPVEKRNHHVANTFKYLMLNRIVSYPNGIPTSLVQSGEQWDYPNASPPLQYIAIIGLDNTNNSAVQLVAKHIAKSALLSYFLTFERTGNMFEMYDVSQVAEEGGGGEYDVVTGFGWTNGLALELLTRYDFNLNDLLDLQPDYKPSSNKSSLHRSGDTVKSHAVTFYRHLHAFTLGLSLSISLVTSLPLHLR